MSQERRLKHAGFKAPFNKSPIDTPGGWEYHGIFDLGGESYARMWQHTEETMELFYDMEESTVAIVKAQYDPDSGKWDGDLSNVVAQHRFVEEGEDEVPGEEFVEKDLQVIALELMRQIPS